MPVEVATPLFFDATCLVAAAGSSTGGSGWLLDLCRRRYLLGAVSPNVLTEAERNVGRKLPAALGRYRLLLSSIPLLSITVPPAAMQPLARLVNAKDAHVLAAALTAGAPYLLTLDKQLSAEVNATRLGVQALSPGAFIRTVLPSHPDYLAFR